MVTWLAQQEIFAAGTDPVGRGLLTKGVERLLPFHCTIAPLTKFEPLTVMVKSGPPTKILGGEKELMTAVGFVGSILKFVAAEPSPFGPGFCTLTSVEPGIATSPAEMDAVSCVLLTNVVARAAPFHCTVAPE